MSGGGGARGGVTFGAGASSTSTADINLRGVSLSNTVYSDVAPCFPLPSVPVFCGSFDKELRLFDGPPRSLNRNDVVSQASKIADLLRNTDVSHLNIADDTYVPSESFVEPLELYNEVIRCNSNAFDCIIAPGPIQEKISHTVLDRKPFEQEFSVTSQVQSDYNGTQSYHHLTANDISPSSRKSKVKKKKPDHISVSERVDSSDHNDSTIEDFCEVLEDFFGKTEIPSDGHDEAEWLTVSVGDLRLLVKEITSICSKNVLHMVPVDTLVRLLRALDHQVHRAEGLSADDCEHPDSDGVSIIYSALESVHAALAIMAHNDMPKHIYKEEIIERILEFSRHQMMEVMSACDPTFRALHKPSGFDGEDDEEGDADFGSASKKRKTFKTAKVKKAAASRVSAAVNAIFQKLCIILVLIKDLLLVERLSDSCILQLVKTCFTTFLVDNIHLLQLKAIVLISGIYYSYAQHRTYIVDETVQLLWKSPVSKRASRAYHLVDEEQRQIQIITALLIQLVHCSTNLPDALRQASNSVAVLEDSFNATYLSKCHEAMTEACALFWSRVLQRFASVKTQDASELKPIIENLVMDLLTTLNLPEYPASAPMLEVLCVLLLQNAGLKSKDISVRSMAIDLLGSIAARLKQDAVQFRSDKYWIIKELAVGNDGDHSYPKDLCSICLDGRAEKSLSVCQGCRRLFHADCMGVREHSVPARDWYCQVCLCRKQLLVLQSYCKSRCRGDAKSNRRHSNSTPETAHTISKVEIVQQMLLNCLQDTGSADDMHLFALWFYLCLWFKDDPNSQDKFDYYLARLQSKAIVRDSGIVSSLLTRDSAKKLTLALGQNSSFSRGFNKILFMLLASLRESSPVIRAKALRAVSIIVEADPEVLVERGVQSAVEGRFCDSAISVREAALELVGRHIASHPEVGLKYFEKVAERIKDTGVSVRKRAIKIIRDMCTSNANFSEFTSACIEIISRVTDEESSVQDLVCKTFYEFWFEEPSTPHTHFYGDNSSVPLEVAKKTEQIVEMLRRMPNDQLLVTIVKRNLALDFFPQSAKAAGISPMLMSSARKRCELMCKYLLERILQVEEMNNVEGEVRTLPYVLALHAFCTVDPTLCAPTSDPSQFVVTLQPYLKSQVDNRVVAKLLESIIFVIDAVLPLVRKLPQAVIEELEQDLKHMIVRHSFLTVVHACIKCLCSVNKVAGKGASIVEYLIQVFFKRLEALGADFIENKQQVGRSLFCLGLLIRYGTSLPSTSGKVIDVTDSLNLLKHYLLVEDFIIKVRSLQALGFVLIARPEYMLEKDVMNLMEAALSSGADLGLKTQALQNMFEYLVDAETQLGSDNSSSNVQYPAKFDDNDPIGANSVPVAAGAGDTNICGGIVQLYWDNILGRCLDINEHVRQAALKIVEVVLRQGLVHPITCVPYLIALETDPQEVNSKLSHHLLMNMNEKYPAFFESRLGDGLQMSFIFIQSMNEISREDSNPRSQSKGHINTKGKSEGSSFAYARLGVSRIYRLIRSNRVSRNKFMSSVVRKFDTPSWSPTVIPFLMYCSEILALLPFTAPDEPLYLIYAINRVVQVRAGSLEANMKALSLQLSPENTQNIPYQNGAIQLHEQNGYNHMASIDLNGPFQQETTDHCSFGSVDTRLHSIPSTSSYNISVDDLQKIKDDCLSATALQLLLKLKRHLKIVYNLNDIRCQAFSPNEPLKAGEVLSKQSIPFDISEIKTSTPTTYQDLLQRYQELKNALKEDTVDYSAYTANIKRKRPTPKKGRKAIRINSGADEDDDDDDDDDDYTGGGRKITNSARKGGSASRVTRQRL